MPARIAWLLRWVSAVLAVVVAVERGDGKGAGWVMREASVWRVPGR
jgi:hypothetical protein